MAAWLHGCMAGWLAGRLESRRDSSHAHLFLARKLLEKGFALLPLALPHKPQRQGRPARTGAGRILDELHDCLAVAVLSCILLGCFELALITVTVLYNTLCCKTQHG